MSRLQPKNSSDIIPAPSELTFNLVVVLPGRASSRHSQRAYYRWIDQYLHDIAGLKITDPQTREERMRALPINILRSSLSAPQLRAWLGMLVNDGHGKHGVNQARSSIVTLAGLLAEAGWIDDYTSAAIGSVRIPTAEEGQRPGRWLSLDEIRLLMTAAEGIAATDAGRLRNRLIATTLCTMALRREELAEAVWGDISIQNNQPVLRVHGKGSKVATVDIPRPVLTAVQGWRKVVTEAERGAPAPSSPLLRRVRKGGHVGKRGLTVDGIWWIISEAAARAGIGHVAPHDLRRSVAGALQESGVTIDKISKLLRHANVAVTERYLSKLPKRNEGAILMSDVLGLEDDEGDVSDF